jgi:hypothetical protein
MAMFPIGCLVVVVGVALMALKPNEGEAAVVQPLDGVAASSLAEEGGRPKPSPLSLGDAPPGPVFEVGPS